MVNHTRWFFNCARWIPTKDEWLKLTSSIGQDELERINKFVFREDAKAALVGQALIRKFISLAVGKPSNELELTRTDRGRPKVTEEFRDRHEDCWPQVFDFNISHSGDYCVLAGSYGESQIEEFTGIKIGVDVNQIVRKETNQELVRFLGLMSRREFTEAEWDLVERAPNDRQKCINFTRLWCLKESFIKADGSGLSFGLNRISFEPEPCNEGSISMDKLTGNIINSTRVILDGRVNHDWKFLETALDDEHFVALAYNSSSFDRIQLDETTPFREVTIEQLIENLKPIESAQEENWSKLCSRSER